MEARDNESNCMHKIRAAGGSSAQRGEKTRPQKQSSSHKNLRDSSNSK
jgi:hypothetical protein